jgi:HK97 gp10 family phage protein
MASRYGSVLEDVNGSFARFIENAPKEVRMMAGAAVKTSTFALLQRMKASAPVGPDAPHIKDDLDMSVRGMSGRAGILKASGEGDSAHIALYQEYGTRRHDDQRFMRPAAMAEKSDHLRRMTEALGLLEKRLGSGVGI